MNSCAAAWGIDTYPETTADLTTHILDPQTSLFRRQGEDSFLEYKQKWLIDLRQQVRRPARASFEALPGSTSAETTAGVPELVWLSLHTDEVEHQYRGEWLLLNGPELLGHSAHFSEIQQRITELGLVAPFVYFVPGEGSTDFIA